jgi:tRNA_anti-like
MKKKNTFIALAISSAIAAGLFGWHEYVRPNPDMSSIKEKFQLKSSSLIHEFEGNDSLAEKKYIGKVVIVKGKLKELARDEKGFYTLVLGDDGVNSSVRCSIDTLHNTELARLRQGRIISVKGAVIGFNADPTGLLGSDVQLNRCIVNDQN